MKRRLLKYAAYGLAVIVTLAVVLAIMVTLPPGERWLKRQLESRLTTMTGQRVEVAALETNLFSRLTLDGIRIFPDPDTTAPVQINIDHVGLQYSLGYILSRRLDIRSLVVDGLRAHISRDSLGRPELVMTDSITNILADTAASSVTVTIDSVALRRIDLTYLDRALLLDLDITGAAATITVPDSETYAFTVDVDSLRGTYDSISVTGSDIALRGDWSPRGLTVAEAHADFEGIMLAATAFLDADLATLHSELQLAGDPQRLAQRIAARYRLPELTAGGQMSVYCRLDGPTEAPRATVNIELPSTRIDSLRLGPTRILARWSPDTLTIDSLTASAFGGSIAGHGLAVIDSVPSADLVFTVSGVDVAGVFSALYHEPSPYRGVLDGRVTASGAGYAPSGWKATGDLRVSRAHYNNREFPDFTFVAEATHGSGSIRIRQGESTVDITAEMNHEHLTGNFEAHLSQLSPLAGWFEQPEVTGRLDASGAFSGTTDNPAIEARLSGGDITFQNFPVDSLSARIQYRDSVVHIDELDITGAMTAVDPNRPPFHIDSISGAISYHVSAHGLIDSLVGLLELNLLAPSYKTIELDSAQVIASIDGPRITGKRLSVYRRDLRLEATADFDQRSASGRLEAELYRHTATDSTTAADSLPTEPWFPSGRISSVFSMPDTSRITLSADGSSIDLAAFGALMPDLVDIGGILQFGLNFTGSMTDMEGSARVGIQHLDYEGIVFDSAQGAVELADKVLNLTALDLYGAGQRLRAVGTVAMQQSAESGPAITPQSATRGKMTASNFDLVIFRPMLKEGGDLFGRATLDLDWAGTLGAPSLNGRINLDGVRYQADPETDPVENLHLLLTVRDSVLTIDTASCTIRTVPVNARGTIQASRWQQFGLALHVGVADIGNLDVNGTASTEDVDLAVSVDSFDLAILRPFAPAIDSLRGRLDCDLTVRGPMAGPEIDGRLEISGLAFDEPLSAAAVRNGRARVRFDRNLVNLDTARLELDSGVILAYGTLTHKAGQISDIDMAVSVAHIRLNRPKFFEMTVDTAALTYQSRQDYFLLDGDVQLGETRFTAGVRPQAILPWAQSVETVQRDLPEILQQTRLNVRVRESNNLWVDNNLARIRLRSGLAVLGSPLKPGFTGRINIEEGYLLYLDRKFQVSRGIVFFTDPNRFNPDIDLSAETKITAYQGITAQPYTITFSAIGTLETLTVGLTSDPVLDKPDIVSLLTLGATRKQLAGSEAESGGGVRNVLVERAAMLSSQKISGYVSRSVGGFLGLDEVSVQGNLFRFDGNWGPQLLASKRITQRMRLTYTTTVGQANDQSFRLDYALAKNLFLEGQTDRYGRSLLNFKYGLRFK